GAVVLILAAMFAASRLVHESIATGAMGMLLPILAIPFLSLALVVWAAASRGLSVGARRAALVATFLVTCGAWTLIRTEGFTGDFRNQLKWRWAESSEEKLLGGAVAGPAWGGRP